MLAVLLYHGVTSGEPWPRPMDEIDREYLLDASAFEAQVSRVAAAGCRGRSFAAIDAGRRGSVEVIFSFDDGDLSGFTTAAPILERHGFRGEFFVVSDWIGRPGFMTVDHLRELRRRGHGIGSHSRTHPRLNTLDRAAIDAEVAGSKRDIEAMTGEPVAFFSVPGGAVDDRVIDAARAAGYAGVAISREGYSGGGQPFVFNRFAVRAYTPTSAIAAICERPRLTSIRVSVKRGVLGAMRRVTGHGGYERLRRTLVSSRLGPAPKRSDR